MTKFVCQLGRYEPLNPSTTRELHGHGVNTTLNIKMTLHYPSVQGTFFQRKIKI